MVESLLCTYPHFHSQSPFHKYTCLYCLLKKTMQYDTMVFLFSASKVTHHRKLPPYRSSCYAGGPTPVFASIQVLNISYFCDFSAQALRKMGAFNKKRRHPRAVNNLEVVEEMPEKVSLKLVHIHDQVINRSHFPLSLSCPQE